ncbi:MAG: AAA family ATPase [Gemmatimonadota bacterium]|nr:AAA family ATPase [Gemmatimonadota bacterium]
MIKSIRLVNFKNFADETLRVGPFTVIVGANASGKSNIRDAFRFLHGIGRGYTLAEIIGGKYGADWKPIRGAANEIVRFGQTAFSIEVRMRLEDTDICYLIEVSNDKKGPNEFQFTNEGLTGPSFIVKSNPDRDDSVQTQSDAFPLLLNMFLAIKEEDPKIQIKFESALEKMGEFISMTRPFKKRLEPYIQQIIDIFANMRFLELSPDQMREPAFPGATVLGDSGENLPVVLENICSDPKRKEIVADWLSELTPMDVAGFEFPRDPSGRVHLTLCEANGRKVSAYSASDGTLRFLAMLSVLLGENPKGLYFFEEIDTGIHPARQWLLLELIEKQAAKNNIQIMTTTHASDLLTFVNDSTFESMSVVCRREDSHDAIIRPVAGLPDAKKLRKSGRGLGGLLTAGWMETALAFTENHDEAEGDGG